jgi:signal peptidase II
MHKAWPGLRWFWGIPFLFLADQGSKWWVLQNVSPGEIISFFPGVQFILAHNTGIAFSLLSQQNLWGKSLLCLFIIAICLLTSLWLARTPRSDKETGWAFMFILGGALGNLFDRLFHGYVIDFIDCYFRTWHWYTFNVADAFITLGACILLKTILSTRGK